MDCTERVKGPKNSYADHILSFSIPSKGWHQWTIWKLQLRRVINAALFTSKYSIILVFSNIKLRYKTFGPVEAEICTQQLVLSEGLWLQLGKESKHHGSGP